MGTLDHDHMHDLHTTIQIVGLIDDRDALLVGIDRRFVSTIPKAANPAAQLLHDLDALNAVGLLADGTLPLATWLANAVALTRARKEAAVFQRALLTCRAAIEPHKLKVELAHNAGSAGGQAAGAGSSEVRWTPWKRRDAVPIATLVIPVLYIIIDRRLSSNISTDSHGTPGTRDTFLNALLVISIASVFVSYSFATRVFRQLAFVAQLTTQNADAFFSRLREFASDMAIGIQGTIVLVAATWMVSISYVFSDSTNWLLLVAIGLTALLLFRFVGWLFQLALPHGSR